MSHSGLKLQTVILWTVPKSAGDNDAHWTASYCLCNTDRYKSRMDLFFGINLTSNLCPLSVSGEGLNCKCQWLCQCSFDKINTYCSEKWNTIPGDAPQLWELSGRRTSIRGAGPHHSPVCPRGSQYYFRRTLKVSSRYYGYYATTAREILKWAKRQYGNTGLMVSLLYSEYSVSILSSLNWPITVRYVHCARSKLCSCIGGSPILLVLEPRGC